MIIKDHPLLSAINLSQTEAIIVTFMCIIRRYLVGILQRTQACQG